MSTSEGDAFMADIPLGAQVDEEVDEEEAEVTDVLLTLAVSMAISYPTESPQLCWYIYTISRSSLPVAQWQVRFWRQAFSQQGQESRTFSML